MLLSVDASRRSQNSRLHSAGHLLDACMKTVGLESMEAGKGHHFPDGYACQILFLCFLVSGSEKGATSLVFE